MTRHRYVIVVETRDDTPPDADPLTERLVQARRSLKALFLKVLTTDQVPGDVDVAAQVRRMDPLNLPPDPNG